MREEQGEGVKKNISQSEIDAMSNEELLAAYKITGDEQYKWPLVLRYKDLIKSAALQIRGVYNHLAQVDDIVSEGILTLVSAIDRYDPEKGVKFETFIAKRIRGMVIDVARKQDWLPRSLRKRTREIDEAVTQLYTDLGRCPTDTEVAQYLGVSVEKYHKEAAGVALGNILSLDALIDMREQDMGWFEMPARDAKEQPEVVFQERELHEMLANGINSLRENEQIVLSLYYEKNLHMKEIAQVMDISAPRVSQIHARAIEKLQEHMRAYMSGADAPANQKRKKD
ncbi:MAG: FliA/WhiG family RNA polymerase sigma factor [Oscillospiraceae bacterium]|nr:FliA/WhiG family RNA polymerase sigma factor [Oscillospiraceae bacterium]